MASYSGPIKNVVVVLFENRSFDNIFGYLYQSANAPVVNDLRGGEQSNPNPFVPNATIDTANNSGTTQLPGLNMTFAATAVPVLDPGEPFKDMAQQILSLSCVPDWPAYTDYAPSTCPPQMQGFTANYAAAGATSANVADIMNVFSPAQVPVSTFLAENFAVSDQWFASAPTQTYTNRAFALMAAPGVVRGLPDLSMIDDLQYVTDKLLTYELPSLLRQLDDILGNTQVNWKVYSHDYCLARATVPYVDQAPDENFGYYDTSDWNNEPAGTFIDDAANGTLPVFSFVEPRYFANLAPNHLPPNSNHPGGANYPLKQILAGSRVSESNPPVDVAAGEVFLMDLFNNLQNSPQWSSTLLIVTYDEHGGCFDHVPPPLATPPGTIHWQPGLSGPSSVPPCDDFDHAAKGFNFNVLGGRVPAIIVSPCLQDRVIPPTANTPLEHATIISTVFEILNLATTDVPSLNQRDGNAPSLVQWLASSAVNDTGSMANLIVAGPASCAVTIQSDGTVGPAASTVVFASAGWKAPLTATSDQPWMTVTSSSTSPNTTMFRIAVDVNSLTGNGPWNATLTLSATGAANSPLAVPVTVYPQS